MQAKTSLNAVMFAIALALAQTIATTARGGQVVTSCADCPTNKAAFSLENGSNVAINYQVKWGNGQWKSFTLKVGHTYTHSHPLNGRGEFPSPYVRFDRIGGDSGYTEKEYEMNVHQVGSGGYGSRRNATEPKQYIFRYAADRRRLDIKAK